MEQQIVILSDFENLEIDILERNALYLPFIAYEIILTTLQTYKVNK